MRTPITTAASLASILLVSIPKIATAQAPDRQAGSWELRIPSGAFIGTGSQRDQVKDANVSALQMSWLVRPRLAITGTFAWARSRDLGTGGAPRLDVFTSDVGVELRTREWFADAPVSFTSFAGLGGGARTYNYRKLDVAATNNVAGYASVGGQLNAGRIGLRLEARDYATGFKPLVGGGRSSARNDVVVMAALSVDLRGSR
jgi:hypothetical protein